MLIVCFTLHEDTYKPANPVLRGITKIYHVAGCEVLVQPPLPPQKKGTMLY